jgi:putative ATP-dependent endonuclease of the OLD family
MRLLAFRAEHFRSLYQTEWISFHDITVLIGQNDGGKTATIEALNVLFGGRAADADDFSYCPDSPPHTDGSFPHETDIILEARFATSPDELNRVQALCPLARFAPQELLVRRTVHLRDGLPAPSELQLVATAPTDVRLHRDKDSLKLDDLKEFVEQHSLRVDGPKTGKDTYISAISDAFDELPIGEW